MTPPLVGVFFFFLFLTISLLLNPATSDTDSPDVSALNVMFNSLNKPPGLSEWQSSGGDPCGDSWKGITCSGSSVTEIKMSGLGLSGSLGYQLSSLTSVTYFDLSKNNLHGDIPYQLPPNAVHIDLSENTFTGGIPYSISQMTDLEYLNLAKNQLTGQLSDMFGKLPKLSEMDLSFNHFSGNLPQSFGSLKSLKTLHLQNNKFNGPIQVLGNLPLNDLNVQNNQFSGPVPAKLKDIYNLQIDGTSLSGSSNSNGGKGGKGVTGMVIAGIVITVLLVIVLLLALAQRRKSSASSPYIDEESCHNRSFTPLVPNDTKEQTIYCSINLDVLQKAPSLGLKHTPSDCQRSFKDNECSIKFNSQHSTGHGHATTYSLVDLQAATGSFNSSRLLGKGSIGSVYKAKYTDGKVLAVKKIDSNLPADSSEDFMDVISGISRLHHSNIAELIGFCSESGYQLLVYEFQRNGSLHEFLHLSDDYSKPLTWETRVRIALGTARAMEYLHEVCTPPCVHKNIKSSNILLDATLSPCLSECGLTAYYQGNNLGCGYNAPESTKPSAYTLKSDVYSFGVVMLELLTGRKPFDSSKPKAEQYLVSWAAPQLHDIGALTQMVDPALRGLYPPKSISRFADIIALCIQSEPEFRPPISQVVQTLPQCVPQMGAHKKLGGGMSASRRSDDSDYGYY